MIDPKRFLENLQAQGVEFFTGVPDSLLNGFCHYLEENLPLDKHVIAANEGNAVGLAAGYYFKSRTIPLVYLQNSGLGNMINPLVSLVDKHVFQVPLLLLIGWRGEPGTGDWAQHVTQGEITPKLLDLLDIPYEIAADDDDLLEGQLLSLLELAAREKKPVALLGRKGVFSHTDKANLIDDSYPLSREEAIEIVLDTLPGDTLYVATTGRATRELYFLREARQEGHQYDFLNVGSMGHASSVALGLALAAPKRRVVCLDGDAAALMHMGALAMASCRPSPNFLHIVLNNGAHESVGGQASAGQLVDFTGIAQASGYRTLGHPVATKEALVEALKTLSPDTCSAFIDLRIHRGLKGPLPALKVDFGQLTEDFMAELSR